MTKLGKSLKLIKMKNMTKTKKSKQKFSQQIGCSDLKYWFYDEEDLDNFLTKFYFRAHKNPDADAEADEDDPQKTSLMYSANTMKNR